MRTRCWGRAALLVALLSPFAFPSEAAAARPLSITIRIDGKDHLVGRGGDNGEAPPSTVWRQLSVTELKPVEGVTFGGDPTDPLRATLRGNIEIDVSSAGKAAVKELNLTRESPIAGWTVDSRDVERIGKEIGVLEGSPTTPAPGPVSTTASATANEPFPWLWVGVGLSAALFVSGIMVTRMRQVRPSGPMRTAGHAESVEPPFAAPE